MALSQSFLTMPTNGLGLLTTIDNLHPEFKIHYQANLYRQDNPVQLRRTVESALDLTVKNACGPMPTPPSTPSPSSPFKKRFKRDENFSNDECSAVSATLNDDITDLEIKLSIQKEVTPKKPIKSNGSSVRTTKNTTKSSTKEQKKIHKAVRKLKFDEKKSSPVSGTIIRALDEIDENCIERSGDIDPQYNIVEVTEEAKAEIALIPNIIGAYECKLCRIEFEDVFCLAQHRCSCIVLLEYKCPECGKRFNCPANLASHRRWHKPRDQQTKKPGPTGSVEQQFGCDQCGKSFKRQAYLRKHQTTHRKETTTSVGTYDSSSLDSMSIEESTPMHQVIYHHVGSTTPSSHDSSSSVDDHDTYQPSNKFHVLNGNFTEDENIAAAALAHLRSGASVIKHTTALVV